MVRVKICGIRDRDAFDAASGADWVGFNFFSPSPRFVTPAQAAALSGGPTRVGLFVEPSDEELEATVQTAGLQIVQVYVGAERAAKIKQRVGIPVWRAVGVAEASDLPSDDGGVDGFVIEAKPPKGSALPGGNARTFDWTVLKGWKAQRPWLLAGGLSAENVAAAVRAAAAPAVDVSSGVERARGFKDPELIQAFITAARALAIP